MSTKKNDESSTTSTATTDRADGRKRFEYGSMRFVVMPMPPKEARGSKPFKSCNLCGVHKQGIHSNRCAGIVEVGHFVCNSSIADASTGGIPVIDTPGDINAYYAQVALLRMGV